MKQKLLNPATPPDLFLIPLAIQVQLKRITIDQAVDEIIALEYSMIRTEKQTTEDAQEVSEIMHKISKAHAVKFKTMKNIFKAKVDEVGIDIDV